MVFVSKTPCFSAYSVVLFFKLAHMVSITVGAKFEKRTQKLW